MDLPELESVRRWLHEHAVGGRVKRLHAVTARALDGAPEALQGASVRGVERAGRTLRLRVGEHALDLRAGTAAAIYVGGPDCEAPPSWRVAMELEEGALWLCGHPSSARARLSTPEDAGAEAPDHGLEPLSAAFTLGTFKKGLRQKRRTIFRILVDGQQIAGIGETYADEILYASRVRPTRPAPTLGDDEIRAVYYSILEILQKAIRFGGISDGQQPYVEEHPGTFGRFLAVHGRRGAPCTACRSRIRRAVIAGSNAFYCPRCQH